MNKLVTALIALSLVAGIYWYASSGKTPGATSAASSAPNSANPGQSRTVVQESDGTVSVVLGDGTVNGQPAEQIETIKPAADTYKSAEEALAAILKGAKEYDDALLEQFAQPGPDCTWCPELYATLRNTISDPATPQEQKSYLAEILAISGRTENVQALLEAVSAARTKEEADVFAEALELTIGGDDVTSLLGQSMGSANEAIRESSVAAITSQGSRLAAELLIQNTLQRGDPDGYYASGIGIGEFIPSEEAIPLFQEMVQKRDEYSHLAVKALINSGLSGLRIVFDEIENTQSPEVARAMLKNATDHVNFEEGLIELTDSVIARGGNPEGVKFAQEIKKEAQAQAEEDQNDAQIEEQGAEQPSEN
jgi:hypothetical protein